jgi:hypothetical protein
LNPKEIYGQVRIPIYIRLLSIHFAFEPERNLDKSGFQFMSIYGNIPQEGPGPERYFFLGPVFFF